MTHASANAKTYFFENKLTHHTGTTNVPARLQAITQDNGNLQLIFRVGTAYYRPYAFTKIPFEKKDEFLQMYDATSTHQFHEKNCTLVYENARIVAVQMPPITEAKKRPSGIEIVLENYDTEKPTQKITATIQQATEVLVQDEYNQRKTRKLVVVWAPNDEQIIGPRLPIELHKEYRTKWTQMFGRPVYRNGIFRQPLTVLVQDDKVVGMKYGTPPIKKETRPNIMQESPTIDNEVNADLPPQITQRKIQGPVVQWQGRNIEVAPYYVTELTKELRANPQEQLTKLLAVSTNVQTIVSGNRELTLFDDKSPIKSITLLNGRVHEITKNPKVDARAWERQSIEAIVYRNETTQPTPEKKMIKKKKSK